MKELKGTSRGYCTVYGNGTLLLPEETETRQNRPQNAAIRETETHKTEIRLRTERMEKRNEVTSVVLLEEAIEQMARLSLSEKRRGENEQDRFSRERKNQAVRTKMHIFLVPPAMKLAFSVGKRDGTSPAE